MNIYTKTGEDGTTGLIGGQRVSKADLRIESYGTVDELNAFLGIIRDHSQHEYINQEIVQIQNMLFNLGSNLASNSSKSRENLPKVQQEDIDFLEKAIDQMDLELEPLSNFILPGGDLCSSYTHAARAICRRAERRVVSLFLEEEEIEHIAEYLNRLSDYLFTLGRFFTSKNQGVETPGRSKA